MRSIKEIRKDIINELCGEFGSREAFEVFEAPIEENRDLYPERFEEYEKALKQLGLTHESYCALLKKEKEKIEEKLASAQELISECMSIADSYNILFSFGIPSGVGDVYNPLEDGWEHSAIC